MAFSVKVNGMNEATAALRALGRDVRAEMDPVVLGGAQVLQRYVQGEASFSSLTGAMRRSIVAKLATRGDEAVAYMGVDLKQLSKRDKKGKIVRYPYFLEHGVRPHVIAASKQGGALAFGRTVRKTVKHPGVRSRQFFRRGVARGRYATKRFMEERLVQLMRQRGAVDASV